MRNNKPTKIIVKTEHVASLDGVPCVRVRVTTRGSVDSTADRTEAARQLAGSLRGAGLNVRLVTTGGCVYAVDGAKVEHTIRRLALARGFEVR